jgi:multiple sugar transport system permease protein
MTSAVAAVHAAPARPRTRGGVLTGAAFALPAFLLMLATLLVPLGVLAWLSFTDYELGAVAFRTVGFDNFAHALADPAFQRSLRNTFLYVAIVLPCAVLLSLALALLVHRRTRARAFYEVIYFLPVTSTLIAMATVWQFLMHPRLGPINAVLRAVGIGEVAFLSEPALVIPALAAIGVWQILGFNMILFLAGLTAIPRDLYEAAEIDGAGGAIDRFLRVTWPMLGPTTMFVTVTTSITAFKAFDTIAALTRGGPMGASEVMLYVVYLEGFQYFHIGYAAALTLIFLGFLLAFAVAQAFALDRRVHYG